MIPVASYRLQLTPDFGFREAVDVIPYLADLGISHIYVSPIFKSRSGSRHGYDGVDYTCLNPELGSHEDFKALAETVTSHGLGWIQDIVPNHMAFDEENSCLMDVLEKGRASAWAGFFDITWDHPDPAMHGRVSVPFLGSHCYQCLENGEIVIAYRNKRFLFTYYDRSLPLRAESCRELIAAVAENIMRETDTDHSLVQKLNAIALMLKNPPKADLRQNYNEINDNPLALFNRLHETEAKIRDGLDRVLDAINGKDNGPVQIDALDRLLDRQHYRLQYWRNADLEVNYRRFFGLNDLIALRQENPAVFEQTHDLILRMLDQEIFTGLRIDHIDGLTDPETYLKRLRERIGNGPLLVEKILSRGEQLPGAWPVTGTTGYDFASRLNDIFVCRENVHRFTAVYENFVDAAPSWEAAINHGRRTVLEDQFNGELDNLVMAFKRLAVLTPPGRDLTTRGIRAALRELVIHFPVYRTYITGRNISQADLDYIRRARNGALAGQPGLEPELFFLESVLTGTILRGYRAAGPGRKRKNLRLKAIDGFQKLTAPLAAKGIEDTALYNYLRLVSLNDVGTDPDRFGTDMAEFHSFLQDRYHGWPDSMNCTATHDSKRGEDVRARLNVLSELPEEWQGCLDSWNRINWHHKGLFQDRPVPGADMEYLIYQTLVGTWPDDRTDMAHYVGRITEYIVKAAREAKIHTTWLDPDKDYESLLTGFVEQILFHEACNPFLEAFVPFAEKIRFFGLFNSLAQVIIKTTAPGMPDFYQGTELLNLTLVDPDNRRAVDFDRRRRMLRELESDPGPTGQNLHPGINGEKAKLLVTSRALWTRKKYRELFGRGRYQPLTVIGQYHGHAAAFSRNNDRQWAITVFPRMLSRIIPEGKNPINEFWRDTVVELPDDAPTNWRNVFTGKFTPGTGSLPLNTVLRDFPVALLINE